MESLIGKIYSIIQGAAAAATTSRDESIWEAESWANLNCQTLSMLYRQQREYHGRRITLRGLVEG